MRLSRRTVVMDTEEVVVMEAVMLDMEDAVPLVEVDTADAVVMVAAAAAVEVFEVFDLDCSRSEGFMLAIL